MSFQLPGSSEAPSGVKLQTRVTERPAPNDKVFVKAEPVVAVKRESQANGSEPEPSGKRPRLSRGSESGDGAGELPTTKAKGFKAHSSGIVPQIECVFSVAASVSPGLPTADALRLLGPCRGPPRRLPSRMA